MKTISELEEEYRQSLNYRATWDTEWRKITDFLLPGRGIYNLYTKPQARKLTSGKVINTVAREALQVLTSGFHGGLTSPSRPWFDLIVSDTKLMQITPIKMWLDGCQRAIYDALEISNFYQTIHSFYTEFAGFGNAVLYCGEDTLNPYRFELLTVGEYTFSVNPEGRVDVFFRTIYKTNRNVVAEFGEDKVPNQIVQNAKKMPDDTVIVINAVYPEKYQDKEYTSTYWLLGENEALKRSGFYEFPYLVGRWELIGSDIYGLGLGSYALPDIQRLQEMEKAFLMGAHKAIDPPLNAPARKKGKVKTLPGGINYYSNPKELVLPMQSPAYDFQPVSLAIGRVETRIRQIFFNDIFLSASRDPNASPLKAAEVEERKEEKLLRIGPVIERVLHEFISPLVERCFNIAARKGLLPVLDPQYADLLKNYTIRFISPLAQAQKLVEARPINTFLQFVTGAAQFSPEALDKINVDRLVDEYADITGVPAIILRGPDEVKLIRDQRAAQLAQEKARQEQLALAQLQAQQQQMQADSAQKYSEAGINMGQALNPLGGA